MRRLLLIAVAVIFSLAALGRVVVAAQIASRPATVQTPTGSTVVQVSAEIDPGAANLVVTGRQTDSR